MPTYPVFQMMSLTATLRILHTSLGVNAIGESHQDEANLSDDASSPILEKFATSDGEEFS